MIKSHLNTYPDSIRRRTTPIPVHGRGTVVIKFKSGDRLKPRMIRMTIVTRDAITVTNIHCYSVSSAFGATGSHPTSRMPSVIKSRQVLAYTTNGEHITVDFMGADGPSLLTSGILGRKHRTCISQSREADLTSRVVDAVALDHLVSNRNVRSQEIGSGIISALPAPPTLLASVANITIIST